MKQNRLGGLIVFGMLAILMILCLAFPTGDEAQALSYTEFWQMAQNGEIAEVALTNAADWQVLRPVVDVGGNI